MRLSVIITNYNYENFIGIAIESALAIRRPDKEIIVVDDGSTDGSREIISSFGDRIITIFKSNEGQGPAATLGLEHSTGEVIIFLDLDDTLLPVIPSNAKPPLIPHILHRRFKGRYDSHSQAQAASFGEAG